MKKDWMYLEELTLDDKGVLINESGKKVKVVKLSSGRLKQNPGSSFPMETGEVPENADAFLLGKSRNEVKIIDGVSGITTHYTTSHIEIDYYQIKK